MANLVNTVHDLSVHVEPFGDSSVMITVPSADARRRRDDIIDIRERLLSRLPVGVLDVVSGLESLLVEFDPMDTSPDHIRYATELLADLPRTASGSEDRHPKSFLVPVVFDAEAGPDLGEISSETGSTVEEVVAAISSSEFTIALLGAAMAPMMDGLRLRRAVRRRAEPRTDVPPGSLMIAGDNAIIQPFPGPSGWRVVGRTPNTIVDISHEPPVSFSTGDRVRFTPIDREAYRDLNGTFLIPEEGSS